MTRFRAQVKRIFDESKITIVGSPTITSDGVASGFSCSNVLENQNFISCPVIQLGLANTWRVHHKFTTGVITRYNWINCITYNKFFGGLSIGITDTKKLVVNLGSTGTSANDILRLVGLTTKENTDYELEIEFTGTKYIVKYKEGKSDWQTYGEVSSTTKLYNNLTTNYIGVRDVLSASQEGFDGQIDLTAFKIYVDGELVYSPTRPKTFLEKRKPKVWNKGQFTIVGNPSISDSGVASGFSNSNYLTIPNYLKGKRNYEIDIEFTLPETLREYGYIFSEALGTTGLSVYYDSTYVYVRCVSAGVNRFVKSIAKGNYKLKIKYNDGIGTIQYCVNNAEEQTYQLNVSNYVDFQEDILYLSGRNNNGNIDGAFIGGSIDLKQFKIYTDNNLVFDGSADTYVYDPSKFTVVGSPTITEYGVASGFSQSNYIRLPYKLPNSTFFKIKGRFKYTRNIQNKAQIIFSEGLNSEYKQLGINIGIASSNLLYAQVGDTITTNTVRSNIEVGNWYWFEFLESENEYILRVSIDNINYDIYTTIKTARRSSDVEQPTIGVYHYPLGYNDAFLGVFDLPSFSITVDGKEVFTGAKEQYYAMRGM